MRFHTLCAALALSFLLGIAAWAAEPQIYFSRSDPVAQVVSREINAAQKSIHVLMYSMTDTDLANALIAAAKRGVDVRIVFDRTQGGEKNTVSDDLLAELGPQRVIFRAGKGRGVMHQKLAIFDGLTVALGSYNWTNNARLNNWENLIVLRDAAVARECQQEFQRIWQTPAPGSGRKKTEKADKAEKAAKR